MSVYSQTYLQKFQANFSPGLVHFLHKKEFKMLIDGFVLEEKIVCTIFRSIFSELCLQWSANQIG